VVTRTEVLRSSEPAKALVEAAERLGVDAIVIASHGRGGLARTLFGSVSEAVLRNARAPVFVVRPPAE
jgi:nucleotide-binding universal stress UspA family protein